MVMVILFHLIIFPIEFKITVDINGFIHSINDNPSVHFYNGGGGTKWWFKHGRKHRLTGPARINIELGTNEYWIEGEQLTQEQFETYINRMELLNEF